MTWLAIKRTLSVAELCDLKCGPVVGRQSGDQTCDHTGLAHAAGVSADHDDRHVLVLQAPNPSIRLYQGMPLGVPLPQNIHLASSAEGWRLKPLCWEFGFDIAKAIS